MGSVWCGMLFENKDLEVVGLCDINPNVLDKLKQNDNAKGIPMFEDYKTMIAETMPDFVLDTTPPEVRSESIKYYIQENIDVLCEKPAVTKATDLAEIEMMLRSKNTRVMVSQNYRWHSAVQSIRKLIQEGEIGEVTNINVFFRLNFELIGWRNELQHVFLIDMAIHHFDLIRYLSSQEIKDIYCTENQSCNAIMSMSKGATANYSGSWQASGAETGLCGEWVIEGTKASIRWSGNYSYTISTNDSSKVVTVEKESADKLAISLGYFVDSIKTASEVAVPFGEHANSLKVSFAAIESAKKGQLVSL